MTARLRLLFSEAWSSISQNLSTTFAATMTVLIGVFLLGLFIALGTWVLSWSDHIKRELQVKVYFATGAAQPTDSIEVAVGDKLKALQHVRKVEFVSKEVAFRQQQKKFPDLYKHVPSNPLPDAWLVTPEKGEDTPALGKQIQATHYAGVDDVTWGSSTAKRVLTIAEVIWIVFLVAVVLLVLASTLLIANTIRLSIFSRRREIEVMKLVGATNWFVRGPFMLEGLICGLVGSVLAVILLLLGRELALPEIFSDTIKEADANVQAWAFPVVAAILVVLGLGIGALGSGITLRRFLRV